MIVRSLLVIEHILGDNHGHFTKKAIQLAKSNHVRLIDGRELEDWLSDLREEGAIDSESDTVHQQDLQRHAVNPFEVEVTPLCGMENHTVKAELLSGAIDETVSFTAERLGKVKALGGAHSSREQGLTRV